MQKQRESTVNGLNGSTELRLHNQVERALQRCFGAEEGLRVLVTLATTQMLATGSSRSAIRHALTRVVTEHPAGEAGAAQAHVVALTAMMLQWSDRTHTATKGPR